ncbi:hypothetical protein KKC44_02275, partial [Patescibacteria group bacterium]|nr:hypothetical protein [Patescibacteria group bacterium]
MKIPFLLLTGLLLLRGSILSSVLPEVSIAQAVPPATAEEVIKEVTEEAEDEHEASVPPKKRDIAQVQRALVSVELRKTEREKYL